MVCIAEFRLTRQLTEVRSIRRYALEVACQKDGRTMYITKMFDTDMGYQEVFIKRTALKLMYYLHANL